MRTVRDALGITVFLLLAACGTERQVPPPDQSPPPGTTQWKIAQAVSAGPDAVGSAATIAEWPAVDTAEVAILRPGPAGWTCFPDDPVTPRGDPICVDDQFMRWLSARRAHEQAPLIDAMAVAYVLKGTAVASETDPLAVAPDSGRLWIDLPPAVLIAMPSADAYRGLPRTRPAAGPWVLWASTRYALIVVPAATPPSAAP